MFSQIKACAPPTFFYKGRCYDVCPTRTYPFDHTHIIEEFNNEDINRATNLQDDEELQSIERKRRSNHLYITNELSEYNENKVGFQVEHMKTISCEPCDISCLQCYGPLNSQCIVCPFGSQLKRMAHMNETYCINLSERSSGNAFVNLSAHGLNVYLLLLISVPFIIVIALVLSFSKFRESKCLQSCSRKHIASEINSTYSYDRVALIPDEENQEEEIDLLNSLPPTIKIYTDDNKNDGIIDI